MSHLSLPVSWDTERISLKGLPVYSYYPEESLLQSTPKRNRKEKKVDSSNFFYMLIFGAIALVTYLILNLALTNFGYSSLFGEPGSAEESLIYTAGEFTTTDPSLNLTLQFDLIIIYGIFTTEIASTVILALFMAYGLKYLKSLGLGILVYLPFIIILSLFK